MLRLDAGRYPHGPDEIAVTDRVAKIFDLRVGGTWDQGGRAPDRRRPGREPAGPAATRSPSWHPARSPRPDQVDVLIRAIRARVHVPRPLPDRTSVQIRGQRATTRPASSVLVLATIGLLFVGLLAVAGFTVMAQRRLRALGMLGAIGASHRHVRLVLLANGAVVGAVGALAGAAVGLAAWVAFGPQLESLLGHRIDRFDLPWALLLVAVLLAIADRGRSPPGGRPAPPPGSPSSPPCPRARRRRGPRTGSRRSARCSCWAGSSASSRREQTKPLFIVGGVLATAVGLLLLAPVGIAALGRLAHSRPWRRGWRCATWRATGPGPARRWRRSGSPSASRPPSR